MTKVSKKSFKGLKRYGVDTKGLWMDRWMDRERDRGQDIIRTVFDGCIINM